MRFRLPALLAAALVAACSDGPTGPDIPYETDLSVPENVLTNFLLSYANRDAAGYEDLLGARFEFLPADPSPWGSLHPDRAMEMTLTRGLFHSPDVERIHIEAEFSEPDEALFGTEEAIRIHTTSLRLDVDEPANVTLQVHDHVQRFYLQMGRAEDGEDPGRYYLRAWDDTGAAPGGLRAGEAPVPVQSTTWTGLKRRFES